MQLTQIYQCLCDQTRLRIVNLLCQGPLCVCHLQEAMGEPQVKISKHLSYLKSHGMVDVRKDGHWRIYSLVAEPSKALQANLACLQDCAAEDRLFRRDSAKISSMRHRLGKDSPDCCAAPDPVRFAKK